MSALSDTEAVTLDKKLKLEAEFSLSDSTVVTTHLGELSHLPCESGPRQIQEELSPGCPNQGLFVASM